MRTASLYMVAPSGSAPIRGPARIGRRLRDIHRPVAGTTPDPELIRKAIEALEPHARHPATGALHDPLYALLSETDPAHLDALGAALSRHRSHPAGPVLRALLAPYVSLPPRTVADVLREHGPLAGDVDPADEVEHRLVRAAEVRSVMERRINDLEGETLRATRTANLMAAVAAMLAVVAVLGWLTALGGWKIDWVEPPAPEPPVVGPATSD